MTEQHLLDNGYLKYSGIFGSFYHKEFSKYSIHVSFMKSPDGWTIWTPSVQGYVDTPAGAQAVRIEGVQWYNTSPDVDTSSHDIHHVEEFFARAVEALGLREEQQFVKCCGACRHWSHESLDWGSCGAEVPTNIIPSSIYRIDKGMTQQTAGSRCPCFEARL